MFFFSEIPWLLQTLRGKMLQLTPASTDFKFRACLTEDLGQIFSKTGPELKSRVKSLTKLKKFDPITKCSLQESRS